MTVTYLPPMTRSAAQTGASLLREVVHEGPAYARSGNRSTRWHLIRSAEDYISHYSGELLVRTSRALPLDLLEEVGA